MSFSQYDTKLPTKENTIFRRIMKCYEQKQYKNGLKLTKQILSIPKYSEHGETLSMKALLLLNIQIKKEEGKECAKRGLKNDLKSFICWHVFGMYQIYDKKYEEAIKCYRNALKIDQTQVQILKDLSKIQIHVRDIDGFKESKYKLLKLRPTQQTSWIQLALAENFCNNFDMCLKILSEYINTFNFNSSNAPLFENSELLKYQNYIMIQAGKYEEALEHLIERESLILDKLYIQETRAKLYLKLGRYENSINCLWSLIMRNQENVTYYKMIEEAIYLHIGTENLCLDDRLHIYIQALLINPKALLPQKIPLQFTNGDMFRQLLDRFLQNHLNKGTPSLYKLIKNLYTSPERVSIIDELIGTYIQTLESSSKFDLDSVETEWPTTLVWTYYLRARHCAHLGNFVEAVRYIDKAIDHTPTFIDAYAAKAKFYKDSGNVLEACQIMEECQSMDTADRYLNCLCGKYFLRANLQDKANEYLAKFTKNSEYPGEDLNEMQCMWYIIEMAQCSYRIGDYVTALYKCFQIHKHFYDMIEDEFDFHTYCPRRCTLLSYVTTLKTASFQLKIPPPFTTYSNENCFSHCNQLKGHYRYFSKAAHIAIQVYLKVYEAFKDVGFDYHAKRITNYIENYDAKLVTLCRKNIETSVIKIAFDKPKPLTLEEFGEKDANVKGEVFENTITTKVDKATDVLSLSQPVDVRIINKNNKEEGKAVELSQSELKKIKNKQKKAQLKMKSSNPSQNTTKNASVNKITLDSTPVNPVNNDINKVTSTNLNNNNDNNNEWHSSNNKPSNCDVKPVEGINLLKVDDLLGEAVKHFLIPLLLNHWHDFETHFYATKIYTHKNKPWLILRHMLNCKNLLLLSSISIIGQRNQGFKDVEQELNYNSIQDDTLKLLNDYWRFFETWLTSLPHLNAYAEKCANENNINISNSGSVDPNVDGNDNNGDAADLGAIFISNMGELNKFIWQNFIMPLNNDSDASSVSDVNFDLFLQTPNLCARFNLLLSLYEAYKNAITQFMATDRIFLPNGLICNVRNSMEHLHLRDDVHLQNYDLFKLFISISSIGKMIVHVQKGMKVEHESSSHIPSTSTGITNTMNYRELNGDALQVNEISGYNNSTILGPDAFKGELTDLLMTCLSQLHRINHENDLINTGYKSFIKACISALSLIIDDFVVTVTKYGNDESKFDEWFDKMVSPMHHILSVKGFGLIQEYCNNLKLSVFPLINPELFIPYIPDIVLL